MAYNGIVVVADGRVALVTNELHDAFGQKHKINSDAELHLWKFFKEVE